MSIRAGANTMESLCFHHHGLDSRNKEVWKEDAVVT